ncbi:MAG: hypothetical protein KAG61_01775 [Bacteriovoracaceae bacterium]|nr:hypothetical protein [Bacteriovoracaceae bacterium]
MLVDIDFNKEEETAELTFQVESFKDERDAKLAIAIVTTFCGDFALDPELETEEFADILEQVKSKDKTKFTFLINEDGIEVELGED